MNAIRKLFANPTARLAARAVVAAAIVAITQIHNSNGGQIAWQSLAVGVGLAFVEVFTPLNALVGVFKLAAPKPVPVTLPVPPPAA